MTVHKMIIENQAEQNNNDALPMNDMCGRASYLDEGFDLLFELLAVASKKSLDDFGGRHKIFPLSSSEDLSKSDFNPPDDMAEESRS